MTLEFICNGYDKKNYDDTTYSITLSAEKDYDEYFKKLLADGKLTAHNSNETINVALRELSWFKNFIFRHVTAINEKHSYLYLVMLEWSTEDDDGVDTTFITITPPLKTNTTVLLKTKTTPI